MASKPPTLPSAFLVPIPIHPAHDAKTSSLRPSRAEVGTLSQKPRCRSGLRKVGVRVDGVEVMSCRVRRTDHPAVLEFVSRNKYEAIGVCLFRWWVEPIATEQTQDGTWRFSQVRERVTPCLTARRFEGRLGDGRTPPPLPKTSAAGH